MFIPPNKSVPNWSRNLELFLGVGLSSSFFLYAFVKGILKSLDIESSTKIAGLEKSPFFPSLKIDESDLQIKHFLDNLPLLLLVSFAFVILRKIISLYRSDEKIRLVYYIIFGFAFTGYLNGLQVFILIAIALFNYFLCHFLAGKKYFVGITWAINFFLLMWSKPQLTDFVVYLGNLMGVSNFQITSGLSFNVMSWDLVFGLFMLKILSFSIDYHWSLQNRRFESLQEHLLNCAEREKINPCIKYYMQKPSTNYSMLAFFAYMFYFPLFIAGPTTTFNAWIAQVQHTQSLISNKSILFYSLRLLIVLILLIALIHLSFYPAIISNPDNKGIWENFTINEMVFASYCILNFIWLKFTFIWRFFRLVCMADGIECPENMGKCMTNNYCFIDFWRNWHKGFNLWLIRYIYVPLGGGKTKIWNIWVIFGFVALWHDLDWKLLAWGWGMCLFIMPEVLIQTHFSKDKYAAFRLTLWFAWGAAFIGGIDCFAMALANLVGFSFGLTGLKIILTSATFEFVLKLYLVFTIHTCALRLIENRKIHKNSKQNLKES